MRKWLGCCLLLGLTACVSNEEKFSDKMEFEPVEASKELTKSTGSQGITKSGEVEWFRCEQSKGAPTFLLLNPENEAFSDKACVQPIAQAFLSKKFNVIAVNRPGQGKSKGKETLGDDASLAAVKSALDELSAEAKVDGIWAFEEGSILGFRLAKAYPFKWLVVGNGIYDWDATLAESTDPQFVADLKKLQEGQDARFPEARSIAWDFSGLPKTIYLYHSATDRKVPEAHASRFRTALAAAEYKVELMSLKDENANITPIVQQAAIRAILESLRSAS